MKMKFRRVDPSKKLKTFSIFGARTLKRRGAHKGRGQLKKNVFFRALPE